jgi:hypothetical protein
MRAKLLMRTLTTLLLLIIASCAELTAQVAPPFPEGGRYVGIVKVSEKYPRMGLNAVPLEPRPDPRTYVEVSTTARVTVIIQGGSARVVGMPGSTLLSLLDEPSFAGLNFVPHYADGSDTFTHFTVEARKGTGTLLIRGNRLTMDFRTLPKHSDFGWNDTEIFSQATVRIELTRTGR